MMMLRRNPRLGYILIIVVIVLVIGLIMLVAIPPQTSGVNNTAPTIDCSYLVNMTAFNDSNANGIQDTSEAGIAGATVTLQHTKLTDPAPQTKTTDSTGSVSMSGGGFCPEGDALTVSVTPPSGYTATTPLSFGPYHIVEILDNDMTRAASMPIPARIYVGLRRS